MGSLQEQLAHLQTSEPEPVVDNSGWHALWQVVGLDPENVNTTATFSELGLADLDIFELAIRGEQQFGKQVNLAAIRSWQTLDDLRAYFSADAGADSRGGTNSGSAGGTDEVK